MKKAQLALGARSYPIYIGKSAIKKIPAVFGASAKKRKAILIADGRLNDAHHAVMKVLKASFGEVHEIKVRAGEILKEMNSIVPLYSDLVRFKADRSSVLIALGGGSVGDAVGFVASTYMRGIDWIGVPSTLLAQVDSSIGGKTAINHPSGKNLIGTFYQPKAVVCDTDLLATLGPSEMVSGLGEIIKTALIFDPPFYQDLYKNYAKLLAHDPKVLERAIQKSVAHKCRAVSRDEHDRKGIREVLNFGHTFGHALETITQFQVFQHGEAVIHGMRFALALSSVLKKIGTEKYRAIDALLTSLPVTPIPQGISLTTTFDLMLHDKKSRNGKMYFVLLRDVGKTAVGVPITAKNLQEATQLMGLKGRMA